ncbi:hypothetical protein PCE1_000061 [Barthelona sp. PCE]
MDRSWLIDENYNLWRDLGLSEHFVDFILTYFVRFFPPNVETQLNLSRNQKLKVIIDRSEILAILSSVLCLQMRPNEFVMSKSGEPDIYALNGLVTKERIEHSLSVDHIRRDRDSCVRQLQIIDILHEYLFLQKISVDNNTCYYLDPRVLIADFYARLDLIFDAKHFDSYNVTLTSEFLEKAMGYCDKWTITNERCPFCENKLKHMSKKKRENLAQMVFSSLEHLFELAQFITSEYVLVTNDTPHEAIEFDGTLKGFKTRKQYEDDVNTIIEARKSEVIRERAKKNTMEKSRSSMTPGYTGIQQVDRQ